MNSEDFTSKIQKRAFSYIELIISMALVVIVILLTAPFMAGMSKKDIRPFGEYICYARYIDGEWKLFQNTRVNSDKFPADDLEISEGETCIFSKPSGVVGMYLITLIGGGGSGSMPYFSGSDNMCMYVALGEDGKPGESKTTTDSLSRLFEDDEIKIGFCKPGSQQNSSACVGRGGLTKDSEHGELQYGEAYISQYKLKKIITKIDDGTLSNMDKNYLNSLHINTNNKEAMKSKIKNLIENKDTNQNLNSGQSGDYTQILLSTGEILRANGGLYGLSDPSYNNTPLTLGQMKKLNNNINNNKIYYTPDTVIPKITTSNKYANCIGADANKVDPGQRYENYGISGQAGIFICSFGSAISYGKINLNEGNINNVVQNACYCCRGGNGAGGAIKIQW